MTTYGDIQAAYEKARRTPNRTPAAGGVARRLAGRVNWLDDLATPFAEWLRDGTGAARASVSGPFGIGGTLAITLLPEGVEDDFDAKEDGVEFLEVRYEGERLEIVDTSRNTGRFAERTLGAMNGLNFATTFVPDDWTAGRCMEEVRRISGTGLNARGAPT